MIALAGDARFCPENPDTLRHGDARLIRSVSEEVQNRRHKKLLVLEDTSVSGIWIDRELGIRQTASHVSRVAAVDHEVIVAIRYENRLSNDREVVGRAHACSFEGIQLGPPSLQGNGLVTILGAFLQPGEVVFRGALAVRGAGKEQEIP